MVMGSERFVGQVRSLLKATGFNLFTRGPFALHCEMKLRKCLELPSAQGHVPTSHPSFASRLKRLREMVGIAKAAADSCGKRSAIQFEPEVPQGALVHCYLRGSAELIDAAHSRAIQSEGGLRVYSHLRGPGWHKLEGVEGFDNTRQHGNALGGEWHYFEWNCGEGNIALSDAEVSRAWTAFLNELPEPDSGPDRVPKLSLIHI
eukprot:TRINITY_DN9549_c0_g1_i1.p2 TRINITY_DN9549_c0_g1~~TRINITY_DN9549_c0_g1_i1.p2  ORF type:complete len:204 (-),score=40.94 TRINITY_DN9549_c0_g1_i1:143-754(-)